MSFNIWGWGSKQFISNYLAGKVSNIDFHIEVSIFPKKEAEMLVLPSAQRKKMDIMVIFLNQISIIKYSYSITKKKLFQTII